MPIVGSPVYLYDPATGESYLASGGGGGGGGDASAANQDEQTALLTTIDADTGAISVKLPATLGSKADVASLAVTQSTEDKAILAAIKATISDSVHDAVADALQAKIVDAAGTDVAFAELGQQPQAASVPVTTPDDASFTVGGRTPRITASMIRASDATQYAAGDLIGNSTTAASVVPITFTAAWLSGGSGRISGARATVLAASGTIVLPHFLLYLFRPEASIPFAAAGYPADNTAFNVSNAAQKELIAVFEFLSTDWLNQAGLATAAGTTIYQGAPLRPLPSGRVRAYAPFNLASIPSQSLLGLMQVQNTWNPGAVVNTFDFALDVDQD